MSRSTGPTREAIRGTLVAALEPLPFVDAFWEAGAAAFGRIDAWSDLDVYAVVDDARVADTFRVVEEALTRLAPIERRYQPVWPPESGTAQAFYRLEGTSEHLLVDLAIFKRSAPDKFLEPQLHGDAVFAFNKGNAVRAPPLDAEAFVRKLLDRRDRLAARVNLFNPFVTKEIHRGNWLEALAEYRDEAFDPLVQVLRMRYHPEHYGFRMRYIHYELPPAVTERLERLAYVGRPEDLEAKHREAVAWFEEAISTVTEEEVRSRLRQVAARPP